MAFGENGESNFNSHNRDDANVLENMSDFLETLVKNALEDLDKINANPRPCPGDEAALLRKGSFEHRNP
jgi:hypothetical protein